MREACERKGCEVGGLDIENRNPLKQERSITGRPLPAAGGKGLQ